MNKIKTKTINNSKNFEIDILNKYIKEYEKSIHLSRPCQTGTKKALIGYCEDLKKILK